MSTIKAKLALDSTGFKAGLDKSKSALSSFKSGIGTIAVGAAAAFASIGAGAALLGAGLKNAFDVGGALNDLKAQTGASIESLIVLQQAFKNSGLEAEKVGPAVAKMRKAIVGAMGDSKDDTFSKLGLDAKALGEMGAAEQLQAIGAAIDGIQNPTAKAAAAMSIFGKSGAEMLTLFSDSGAMGSAAEQIGSQAQILDKNAALFDDVGDKLSLVGSKLQGFYVGMASAVAPVLASLADTLATSDFSSIGKSVGDAIANVIAIFKNGDIGSLLLDSLIISGAGFINFMLQGITGIGNVIKNLLLAASEAWVSAMMKGVAGLFAQLGKIKGLGGLKQDAAELDKAAAVVSKDAAKRADVGGSFAEGQKLAPQIDTSDAQKRFNEVIDAMGQTVKDGKAKADAFLESNKKPAEAKTPLAAVMQSVGAAFTSSLAKIGGGGSSVGGSDPMLAENRRQTSLLEQIRRNTLPAKQVTPNLTARFA